MWIVSKGERKSDSKVMNMCWHIYFIFYPSQTEKKGKGLVYCDAICFTTIKYGRYIDYIVIRNNIKLRTLIITWPSYQWIDLNNEAPKTQNSRYDEALHIATEMSRVTTSCQFGCILSTLTVSIATILVIKIPAVHVKCHTPTSLTESVSPY